MDGTATAGEDYTTTSEILNFAGNTNETQTLTVSITDDAIVEVRQRFTVSLSELTGTSSVAITDTGTVTIISNNDEAEVLFGDLSPVREDAGFVDVPIILDNAVEGGFTVRGITSNSTARAGTDYTTTSQNIRFAGDAGEVQIFRVPIIDDDIVESIETFSVFLIDGGGLRGLPITADDDRRVTIRDDDSPELRVADVTVNENVGSAVVVVTLNVAVPGGFAVVASTANGTATAGEDYAARSRTLNFVGTAGEEQILLVPIIDNSTVGIRRQTFGIIFGNATGTSVTIDTDNEATVTIVDNESAQLIVGNVVFNENAGTAEVVVRLSGNTEGPFAFRLGVSDGTAIAGEDYTSSATPLLSSYSGTNNATGRFQIPITDDDIVEGSETFTITFIGAEPGYSLDTPDTATITINDNDTAQLTVGDVTVTEGDNSATVEVSLDNNAVQGGFKVTASTADGTATAGEDYTATTTDLIFTGSANQTQTLTVPIRNDTTVESSENFTVSLSGLAGPAGIDITDTATVIINDDNDRAELTIEDVTVGEDAGNAAVVVSLNNAVEGGFTVTAATADGTATAGDDYTDTSRIFTFAGNENETQTLTVPINDDGTQLRSGRPSQYPSPVWRAQVLQLT